MRTIPVRQLTICVLCALATACKQDQGKDVAVRHRDGSAPVETRGRAQVLLVGDLVALGFDTTKLGSLEAHFRSHFRILDSTLVTLATLKQMYDTTSDTNEKNRLNTAAIPFHLGADTHERAILQALRPPLDSIFDTYVAERKKAVGIFDWHVDHRSEPRTSELPGLVPQPPRKR